MESIEESRRKKRDYQREYRAQNPERCAAGALAARRKNPETYRLIQLRHVIKKLGLDPSLAYTKPEVCSIPGCGSTRKISFDHCHATGKFRGWLCDSCNIALGRVHDNPAVLRALADYLEA